MKWPASYKASFTTDAIAQDCDILPTLMDAAAESDPQVQPLLQRIRCYPEVQLFDLEQDPWEMNNIANNPEYCTKVKELKAAVSNWMKEQGDEGNLEGEGIKYADMPFVQVGKN
jgi:uncharacterized sulfatase